MAATSRASPVGEPIELPARFDPVGGAPEVHTLGTMRFLDTGPADGSPVVFFGGLGTSAAACLLIEFARGVRERLGLRVISVERNGFGETPFDPELGLRDVADDALAVLEHLDVERFAIVAFSGGGPYAAALAAAAPDRVISMHLAAAVAGPLIAGSFAAAAAFDDAAAVASDPRAMWEYPPDSPVHRIPGFQRAAGDEGVRALGADGRGAAALAHEWRLLRTTPLPDLRAVRAPAYLYWGAADEIVPPEHADAWRRALPNVAAARCYPGEAHDIQYRHWDQILVDLEGAGAGAGDRDRILVCHDGRTWLVAHDELPAGATLGLCCWNADKESRA